MDNHSKKKEWIVYLKSRQLKSSFRRKEDLLQYISDIQWAEKFPWREEQQKVIDCFLRLKPPSIIGIQGLFGCGKTTLLLGMLNIGYWKDMFTMSEICFCAFNVCIKNEIKKKIKKWGCKELVHVRTFDSLIYEICQYYEYPNMKQPNYNGKRMFIYDICVKKEKKIYDKYFNIKYLFVDESQDLEKQAFQVFKTFFPNAVIIFVGDIFQSVQKEPRESLLWYISQDLQKSIHYFYMKDTPRVPFSILCDIKKALTQYYPEYSKQISDWKSSSPFLENKIEWISFKSYKELYEKMFEFLEMYPPEKSMVLTFSSCITVRGALGDLSRIRRIIQQKGYPINLNYKSMKDDCLFLSTANSSKGLERDYVFVMSTFPLEKAFLNFSNDLTTNLVTVALSRSKNKVIVCVPTISEKFSNAFYAYEKCPLPLNITSIPSNDQMSLIDYIYLEHSTTELLRQNIIQYHTRILFKSFVKKQIKQNISNDEIIQLPKDILKSEEERCFVGVCIEVLITSVWTNKYPNIPDISEIESNPYYIHCISKIKSLRKFYIQLKKQNNKCSSNTFPFFQTLFVYTELFIAINHKIFFYFNAQQKQSLFMFWQKYRKDVYKFQPPKDKKFEIQKNVRMPLITGIVDGLSFNQQKHFYEIKASIANDWSDNAFIQAFIYAIMLGQSWFHIHLINLFKNKSIQYVNYIDNVMNVRNLLMYDVLLWNINSYLAKTLIAPTSKIEKYMFVHYEMNQDKLKEIVVFSFFSPTRIYISFHDENNSIQAFHDFIHIFDINNIILCHLSNPLELKYPSIKKFITEDIDFEHFLNHNQNEHKMKLPSSNIVVQSLIYIAKFSVLFHHS
jgi:hypothetical protein